MLERFSRFHAFILANKNRNHRLLNWAIFCRWNVSAKNFLSIDATWRNGGKGIASCTKPPIIFFSFWINVLLRHSNTISEELKSVQSKRDYYCAKRITFIAARYGPQIFLAWEWNVCKQKMQYGKCSCNFSNIVGRLLILCTPSCKTIAHSLWILSDGKLKA